MKLAYKRLHQFSLFSLKIFEWKTDYIEKSSDEDDLFIRIVDKEIKDTEG